MISFSVFYMSISVCVCVLQEKLVQAIKRIKHEVDECREAERETYVEAVDVEVSLQLPLSITSLSLLHFYQTQFWKKNNIHITVARLSELTIQSFLLQSFRPVLMPWNEKSDPSFRTSIVSWMRKSVRTSSD